MAKIIDEMPKRRRGPRPLYPWDEWFDGQARRLEHGADFTSSPAVLRTAIHKAAVRRGMTAQTVIDGSDLLVQAFPR